MKKSALTLAVVAVCFLGVGCTTPGGTDKAGVRPAVAADGSFDGSFDGKYERRTLQGYQDADLIISGAGGSFRAYGNGCHRGIGSPLQMVAQSLTVIQFSVNYQGSIAGCADAKIHKLKKAVVDGKNALADARTGEVLFFKQ
ncbi:hypothetical protein LP417_35375 (plasmid) [Polaromonas sp. P1-6]|nr:hypothetical protein LP417_35375 [Polaromonas sp. P1-6]